MEKKVSSSVGLLVIGALAFLAFGAVYRDYQNSDRAKLRRLERAAYPRN